MTTRPEIGIVQEDEHLMVIEKPAGMVVHPAPGHDEPTVAEILGDRLAGGDDPERVGIVHRLDRGTSGLMIVARSDQAHSRLQEMIGAREIDRTYTALVAGAPRSRTGTIDAPIGRSARERHRMAVSGSGPRTAVTHFEVDEVLGRETLVTVHLETGRTHQIRVHFQAIGNPLVGDPTYGGPVLYGLSRPFLHSSRLAFTHPLTGERITLESELPNDLAQALEESRRAGTSDPG